MAVPKKKVSRSRRDQRRHSSGYEIAEPASTLCAVTGEATRSHRVGKKAIEMLLSGEWMKAKKEAKASKKAAAKKA